MLPHITGQLIVHHTGKPLPDGRELVAFAMILAVPKGSFPKNLHQYTVVGRHEPNGPCTMLTVMQQPEHEIDRTNECLGAGIGDYFTQAIWRC